MDYINSNRNAKSRAVFVRTVRGWIEDFLRQRTDLDDDATPTTTTATTATTTAAALIQTTKADSSDDEDDGLHGYTVLVQEMTCNIPGCAPIETVVALLKRGANHNGKIFKPIAEVTKEEANELLDQMLRGETFTDGGDASTTSSTSGGGSGEKKSTSQKKSQLMQTDNDPHPFLCPCCNPEVTKFDKMLMFGPGLDHI